MPKATLHKWSGQWALDVRGGEIGAWVKSANQYAGIARVTNERSVRQMLRYAKLGEDVEHVIDKYVAGKIEDADVRKQVGKLVYDAVRDIMPEGGNKVSCPTVEEE